MYFVPDQKAKETRRCFGATAAWQHMQHEQMLAGPHPQNQP